MKRLHGKISIVLAAVLIAALCVFAAGCSTDAGQAVDAQPVYMVYFGLNDADTGTQEVSEDEAAAYIRGVITDAGYGYTEYSTIGAYVEDGAANENVTLVYMLTYLDEAAMKEICAEVKTHLNLDSVFYSESSMICGYAA